MEFGEFSVCDVLECVVELFVGVGFVDCVGSEEGIYYGSVLSFLFRVSKQVVFVFQGQGLDFVFDEVVVD